MTAGLVIRGRRIGSLTVLAVLVAAVVVVALITPESVGLDSGGRSSYSTGSDGTRIVYELAQRMGWQVARRESLLDSATIPSVQVVLAPEQALGAAEVHRLLDNVRRGGGLIFDVDGADEIADSIGISLGNVRSMLVGGRSEGECAGSRSFTSRATFSLPPTIRNVRWRRPPPGTVTQITAGGENRIGIEVGAAFPMGRGRVAAVSSSTIFSNDAVQSCGWGADVASAQAFELVRLVGVDRPTMVVDEYHHGRGTHGGSMRAVSLYLARTRSGHFLAQAMVAAFILLLAKAPRPIVPRDPERIPRRSPLEHADALGHAYADVAATRTATSRLVSGLRRRAGRTVAVHGTATDSAFLDAVVRRTPTLAASAAVIQRALTESLPLREFSAVGGAVREIEQQLTTSPPVHS